MKRIALFFLLISLAAGAITAQPVDLQLAVATQAMTQNMLENLGLSEAEIRNILRLQEQFRLMKEQNNLDLNVIKAQIAQMLYKADANSAEVGRLLEMASELRLEQEQEQVKTYLDIRKEMGEEQWAKLMQQVRVRTQTRNTDNVQNSTRENTRSNSGSGSSGNSGSQSQGSSNR